MFGTPSVQIIGLLDSDMKATCKKIHLNYLNSDIMNISNEFSSIKEKTFDYRPIYQKRFTAVPITIKTFKLSINFMISFRYQTF